MELPLAVPVDEVLQHEGAVTVMATQFSVNQHPATLDRCHALMTASQIEQSIQYPFMRRSIMCRGLPLFLLRHLDSSRVETRAVAIDDVVPMPYAQGVERARPDS